MPIDADIRKIIEQDGWITIDNMMKQVLDTNINAYYRNIKHIGADGDFITAPEISQLFGETIALWALEQWQRLGKPKKFILLELGPGRGKLMQDFLRTVKKIMPDFFKAANIYLADINPHFVEQQKKNLNDFGKKIVWIEKLKKLPYMPIIFIANEFFDAMPIKQYVKEKENWREYVLVVDPIDGMIKYKKTTIRKALQEFLKYEHPNAKDGAVVEESLRSLKILRILSNYIYKNKGAGLIIDYGYYIESFNRLPTQYNQTLQAIKNHQYQPVLSTLGEADLSSHVDFYAFRREIRNKKIKDINIFLQKDFLCKYGIEIRAEMLKNNLAKTEQRIINDQLNRLINPKQMGEIFKVLEFKHLVEQDNLLTNNP